MRQLDLELLMEACRPGGSSVLTAVTDLVPAAGQHAGVAPPRFVRGTQAAYAFATRYVSVEGAEPQPMHTVLLDSKASQANRIEEALALAIEDGDPTLARTPRMRLVYDGLPAESDLTVPHRFADAHMRGGSIAGEQATDHPIFRAMRDSNAANARPLLEASPISLVMGAWDSTRKSHQARFRSLLVGEIMGVLADQTPEGLRVEPRGGGRSDQISPSVKLSPKQLQELMEAQESELGSRNVGKIRHDVAKAKSDARISAAGLGFGSIPPSLDELGLVACSRIIRSHVLSFSALRQIRFGLGSNGDATVRSLLAALALVGLVRSYAELVLRANCDLKEAEEPRFLLDGRYGKTVELEVLTIQSTTELLRTAIEAATSAGVQWAGQVLEVKGNPIIAGGIEAEDE